MAHFVDFHLDQLVDCSRWYDVHTRTTGGVRTRPSPHRSATGQWEGSSVIVVRGDGNYFWGCLCVCRIFQRQNIKPQQKHCVSPPLMLFIGLCIRHTHSFCCEPVCAFCCMMSFVHVCMNMHVCVRACLLIGLMNDYVHNICMFVFWCVGVAEKWDDFAETSKQKVERKFQTSCPPHTEAHLCFYSCGNSHSQNTS